MSKTTRSNHQRPDNSRVLRVGMIGCGAIAELYHLPAMRQIACMKDGIVLVEPNAQRRSAMARKFAASETSPAYEDVTGCVDAVVVATPPATHYEICKWFLEHGIHVLCEKPLTEDSQEARELVELAKGNNVHLAVNQTRRLFPTYQLIRQLVADGELGTLKSIHYHPLPFRL